MAGDWLFTNTDMSRVATTCQQASMKAAEKIVEEQPAILGTDQLVKHIVAESELVPLQLDIVQHHLPPTAPPPCRQNRVRAWPAVPALPRGEASMSAIGRATAFSQ
jgi:hypothetical protein